MDVESGRKSACKHVEDAERSVGPRQVETPGNTVRLAAAEADPGQIGSDLLF